MKLQAYSVFDSKAKFFVKPFYCANDMVALRLFASAASDRALDIGKFPTDFSLFHVGEWDDDSGTFTQVSPLRNLGLAAQFIDAPVSSVAVDQAERKLNKTEVPNVR